MDKWRIVSALLFGFLFSLCFFLVMLIGNFFVVRYHLSMASAILFQVALALLYGIGVSRYFS